MCPAINHESTQITIRAEIKRTEENSTKQNRIKKRQDCISCNFPALISKTNVATSMAKRRIPGPASKTGRRPIENSTFAKEVSNCWNLTSLDPTGFTNDSSKETSKNSTRNFTTHCLLCFQKVKFLDHKVNQEENFMVLDRSKLIKNLCSKLNLNCNEIPETCSRRAFPFCELCESTMELALKHQQEIESLERRILKIVNRLQKKVVLEAVNTTRASDTGDGEEFTKLREMIIEGYHIKCGTNIASNRETDVDAETLPGKNSDDSVAGSPTSTNEVPPEGDPIIASVEDSKATSFPSSNLNSTTAAAGPQESLEPDDDIQPLVPRKRRLLCDGVEYFRSIRTKDREHFDCSLCNYTVQISKKRQQNEPTPTIKISTHIRTCHKSKCKRKPKTRSSSRHVKAEDDSCSGTSIGIKQEKGSKPLNTYGTENDTDFEDVHALERTRKYKHKGVEIFKCSGSLHRTNRYLQCGSAGCDKKFSIQKIRHGETLAYNHIRRHIESMHIRQEKQRAGKGCQRATVGTMRHTSGVKKEDEISQEKKQDCSKEN